MSGTLRVAAVQMVSSDVAADNLDQARALIASAAADGARLVVLPENFAFMGRDDRARLTQTEVAVAEPDRTTPIQRFLRQQARERQVWLAGGTVALGEPGAGRVHSAMLVYAPDGRLAARYDKIHLFDVDVADGARYRESQSTLPGEDAVVTDTPFGRLGLAICYDLRFPELFRIMSDRGMSVCALASAFTVPTGQAHWETLVRARAIENLSAVVAACQGGTHAAGRETFGHSMIVDAWGRVLAVRERGAGVIVADIDLAEQARLRERFPVLDHRRPIHEFIEDHD